MNERIRELFTVEPAEFVGARDALAKELRAAGRDAEAKEVAALRRPTAAVWAVNQLARKNSAELEQFVDASDRVRHAQVRGGSADDLRAAMTAQRTALAKLEQAAAGILSEAGTQASPGALRTVQATLQAAGSTPGDLRKQLVEGTLREALEPAGFDALLAAGPVHAAAHHGAVGSHEKASARRQGHGSAASAERDAAKQRRAAEREAKRQLAAAKKRAAEARAAEKRLRALEQRARAADASAEKAREALEAARAKLDRLRTPNS
ncbi:MAG TPA: hypothetical protein VG496_19190 [Myxococcales bacterium]|nr:hypothetical protein [Myxococcales bacterium]